VKFSKGTSAKRSDEMGWVMGPLVIIRRLEPLDSPYKKSTLLESGCWSYIADKDPT
jgi:hypothetical protein